MKVCIYHESCVDGFTAAWICRMAGFERFISAQYGDAPPLGLLGSDDHVAIVDFSYPREVLLAIKQQVRSLIVLDHHKTAQAALEGLNFCQFDMQRSGAMMAWNLLFGGPPRRLVAYVQDRDLWKWELPDSKSISAAIASYSMTWENWDYLGARLDDDLRCTTVITEGMAILRYQNQLVDRIAKNAEEVDFGGHRVLAVNSGVFQSEIGERIAEGRPFGVVWFQKGDQAIASLRSCGGIDVSEVAKRFGGGGHAGAAGCKLVAAPVFTLNALLKSEA